jgi:tetratricopeptide (TPR) repeat protein
MYCLRHALSENPEDVDALWDHSFLLKEDGKTDAAIRGFNKLLEITPHHVKVIDELAKLYRSKDDLAKAVELYEGAMDYHFENDKLDEPDENAFRYTEINMLTELYIMMNEYEKALMCIKYGILYLQRRIDEIDWTSGLDPEDLDEDFDRTPDDPSTDCFEDFPVELRARMAVCRIYLDHFDVAKVSDMSDSSRGYSSQLTYPLFQKHVGYLEKQPVTEYSDLYQEVAAAYMEKGKYDLALILLQRIIDEEEV